MQITIRANAPAIANYIEMRPTVDAWPTRVHGLVITPRIHITDDLETTYVPDEYTLVHQPTGMALPYEAHGYRITDFSELATATNMIADEHGLDDWTFGLPLGELSMIHKRDIPQEHIKAWWDAFGYIVVAREKTPTS